MRQVLQPRSGVTAVREVPAPPCRAGSVLVRNAFSVISSGTERSRLLGAQRSLLERARERPDLVKAVARRALTQGISDTRRAIQRQLSEGAPVGYCSAGHVVELGGGVVGLGVGDAVACAGAGHANHADVVSVPANLCAKVPSGVSLEAASLSTIAAIALHGLRLGNVGVGDRVAVIGCGLVGQILCRLLRCAGAMTFAADIDPRRLEDARRGGADEVFLSEAATRDRILRATGQVGVDVAIVTAATVSAEPLRLAADVTRDRGTLVLVGDVPIDLPREVMYRKELGLRVSRSYGPGRYDKQYEERGLDYPIGYVRWTEKRNMEAVLDLQARGLLRLEDLIEEIVPVRAAPTAYDRLAHEDTRPRGALLLSYADDGPPSAKPHVASRGARAARSHGSRAVRMGFIGPGDFARSVIIPAFAAAGAELELVGGGAGPSAEATRRQFGFARIAADERAVLEDEHIDAVAICTRHGSHATLASDALASGKHVFCEKPLALSTAELERVLDAAARSDRVLAVGFNRRFSPPLRVLRRLLDETEPPFTITYRVAAGHVPADQWQSDLVDGGGRVLGEACHFVDAAVYLAGARVTQVQAVAQPDDERPLQARDNVVTTFAFANGSIGTLAYAAAVGPGVPKERIEAHSAGASGALVDFRELELFTPEGRRGHRSRRQQKGHPEEVCAFLDAVRAGHDPVPLDELENVSLATFAIVESLRTGGTVSVRSTGSEARGV